MLQACQGCRGKSRRRDAIEVDSRSGRILVSAIRLPPQVPRKSLRFQEESGKLEIPSESEFTQRCVIA